MRDQAPPVGGHGAAVLALHDDGCLVGRGDVVTLSRVIGERFRAEDLGQLGGGPLLGEPSAHARKSSIVRTMDDAPPPPAPLDPGATGRLTRDAALAMLQRGGELLASGDFADARLHFYRVVGFDDPVITAAALLGLGEAHYRLDDEAQAVASWMAVLELPETPSTYPAWRNIAAARVRDGDLNGAITAYREADRRAPAEDKAEIAGRLGWLNKETGNTRASQRYFARSRGDGPRITLTLVIIALTSIISLTALFAEDGQAFYELLQLDKPAVADGGVLAAVERDLAPWRPAPPRIQHVRALPRRHDRRALVRLAALPRLLPGLRRRGLGGQLRVRWRRAVGRGVGRDLRHVRRPPRRREGPPPGRSAEPRHREPADVPRRDQYRVRLRVRRLDRQRGPPRRAGSRAVARRDRATDPRPDDVRALAAARATGGPAAGIAKAPGYIFLLALAVVAIVVVAGLAVGTSARG